MAAIVIEVPENLKELAERVVALVNAITQVSGAGGSGAAVLYADVEQCVSARCSDIEHAAVLASLDVDAAQVRIDGCLYRRVGRYPQSYKTLAGPVAVTACSTVRWESATSKRLML